MMDFLDQVAPAKPKEASSFTMMHPPTSFSISTGVKNSNSIAINKQRFMKT